MREALTILGFGPCHHMSEVMANEDQKQLWRALAKGARWDEKPTLPAMDRLFETVKALPARDTTILDRGTFPGSGALIEATYLRPYQLHASIGPSCAVARFSDGSYTVWTHSQGVYPLR